MVHNDVTNCWEGHCKGIFTHKCSHTWSKNGARNITSGCSFISCSLPFARWLRPLYILSHNTAVGNASPHQPSSWGNNKLDMFNMWAPLEGAPVPLKPTLWLPLVQRLYIKTSWEVTKAIVCLAKKKRTRYFHMLEMIAKGKLRNLIFYLNKVPWKCNIFLDYGYMITIFGQ